MASTICLSVHLTNLRRDVSTQHIQGGMIDIFASQFKGIVVATNAEISDFQFSDRLGRVDVKLEVGIDAVQGTYDLTPGLPGDPIGFLKATIDVEVPDVVAFNFQADGTPGAAWRDDLVARIPAAFVAAGGNDFINAIQADGGMHVEYLFSVTTYKE